MTRPSPFRLALAGLPVLVALAVSTAFVADAAPGDPDPTFDSAYYKMSYDIGDSGTLTSDAEEASVTADADRQLSNSVNGSDGDASSTNNRIRIARSEGPGGLSSASVRADAEGSASEGSQFPPGHSPPSAGSVATAQLDFEVVGEVEYTITAATSATDSDAEGGCASASAELSRSADRLYTRVASSCDNPTTSGSASGTLTNGRYRISAVGRGDGVGGGGSASYAASVNVTITFGTGSLPHCDGTVVTIEEGDASANTIAGTGGPDVINGLGANDTISGEAGNDRLCGSGGDDTLFGGGDALGSDGKDRLFGAGGADALFGGDQRDLLFGASGADRELDGGPGNDLINSGGGADKKVFGRGGNDELKGGGANDVLRGNGGNDDLSGGPGNKDKCIGGGGTDEADESCEIVKSIEELPLESL